MTGLEPGSSVSQSKIPGHVVPYPVSILGEASTASPYTRVNTGILFQAVPCASEMIPHPQHS